jgi:hypothetical protein
VIPVASPAHDIPLVPVTRLKRSCNLAPAARSKTAVADPVCVPLIACRLYIITSVPWTSTNPAPLSISSQPVGGELLICDKNQTVGCSALVRSSFSRIRYKSFTYCKSACNPDQRSSSWVRSGVVPHSPTQKPFPFLPLTTPLPHSPHVRVRPTPNRQVGLGGIPIRIGSGGPIPIKTKTYS